MATNIQLKKAASEGNSKIDHQTDGRSCFETTLRGNGPLFEAAFENAAVGVSITDVSGRFLEVNKALCAIVGYSEEELLSTNFAAISHAADMEESQDIFDKVKLSKLSGYVYEKRYLHKTGRVVWVQNSISFIRDDRLNAQFCLAFTEDITSRKYAQAAQQLAEDHTERLLSIGSSLGEAITKAQVANVIVNSMCSILRTETCLVALHSNDGRGLIIEKSIGVPQDTCDHIIGESCRSVSPLMESMYNRKLIVYPKGHNFFENNPKIASLLSDPDDILLCVPLLVGEKTIGSVAVICSTTQCCQDEQKVFIWAMGGQCAQAVERAHLYDEARREVEDRMRAEDEKRASEEKFFTIVNSSNVAYALTDQGKVTFVNAEFSRTFGYLIEDIPTVDEWWILAFPDKAYRDLVKTDWLRNIAEGEFTQIALKEMEINVCCKDGSSRTVIAGARSLKGANSQVHVVSFYDITERKRIENEKAHLIEYNRLLLESTAEGIYGLDTNGCCTFINNAACDLIGFTPAEAIGKQMHALIHHTHKDHSPFPLSECPMYVAIQKGVQCHSETEILWRKDGSYFDASYSVYPLSNADGLLGAVVTFSDITSRKRIEEEKERLLIEAQERADRDPLTGLLNHRAFYNRLDYEAAKALREQSSIAVVMLDLDNFKFFNDVYGHAIGDEVLLILSKRLQEISRPCDTIARFGGDEFALLLPGIDNKTADEIEYRLRESLHGLFHYIPEQDTSVPVSTSLGAAMFPDASTDSREALRLADERLRWSKTGGGAEASAQHIRNVAGTRVRGFSMLDALVTAVDNKDRYTRKHSEDVMEYSLMIYREMGLDEASQHTAAIAALLHDVGKIGVPDAILRKPGKLTNAEYEAIKQHPTMGAVMVSSVEGLEETLDAVRHHHERWDGKGYPDGLVGEETPFIARVMAVADAFSAMTTDRPYRKGMDQGRALTLIAAGAGTQWDPVCVDTFLNAWESRLELDKVA